MGVKSSLEKFRIIRNMATNEINDVERSYNIGIDT